MQGRGLTDSICSDRYFFLLFAQYWQPPQNNRQHLCGVFLPWQLSGLKLSREFPLGETMPNRYSRGTSPRNKTTKKTMLPAKTTLPQMLPDFAPLGREIGGSKKKRSKVLPSRKFTPQMLPESACFQMLPDCS